MQSITRSYRILMAAIFLSFILCGFACFADLASDTVYLTWQQSPTSTMTIQWISGAEDNKTNLEYRAIDDNEWLIEKAIDIPIPRTNKYILHRVELVNLNPDSNYLFKLSDKERLYKFRTMAADLDKPICFVVGGDMYHDDDGTKSMCHTCLQASKMDPCFALLGGDIAYAVANSRSPEIIERWVEWVQAWNRTMISPDGKLIPVISAIGNHDILGHFDQTPSEAKVFSTLFPMPGAQVYNVLDFNKHISFIILDSGHANQIEGSQTKWLKTTLQNRKDVTHKFAIYHVPAYPSFRSFDNRHSSAIRRNWVPIFEKEGVKMAFEHHDHAYKRTHPLWNNKVNPNGVVYMGDGAWSVDKPRSPFFNTMGKYFAKSLPSLNFIVVTIEKGKQSIVAYNQQGQKIDEYSRVLPSTIEKIKDVEKLDEKPVEAVTARSRA
ncbi:MAG: metallophosphoesterase family protein [Parachlamydiaceae bacterium]|nr:metallophosphoesterase family protein [Parachlamydiaceae bacterium]